MSAPTRRVHMSRAIVDDLAIRDTDPFSTEIHRVLTWVRLLDSTRTQYVVACGLSFRSPESAPVSLSSGEVAGYLCRSGCWSHLITEAVAS